jgi:hypothetical protein
MPHPSLDSFYFWNSGSEAIEATLKMARVFTGRQNVISMQGIQPDAGKLVLSLTLPYCRRISWSYLWRDGCYEEQDGVQRGFLPLDGELCWCSPKMHVILTDL